MRLSEIGRGQRNRDHTGIEAAEERGNELKSGLIEQQRALAVGIVALQQRPYGAGLTVQRRLRQMIPFRLSVGEEGVGTQFGLMEGSPT